MITVTTDKASLENGLKIGATYGAFQKIYDNYELHGSEIESRTYAIKNKLAFRLDYASTEYEMKRNEVPGTTDILLIEIYPYP